MKTIKLVILALVIGLGSITAAAQAPKNPTIFDVRVGVYGPAQFDADVNAYESAISAKDFDRAKAIRDSVVFHVKSSIDVPYGSFKNSLYTGTAKRNTIFDIAAEVALTAIGITRNIRTKDIITTILQGGQSARKSYEANFFKGQTLWMVIASMDASRLKTFTAIETNLQGDVATYSLYQALSDEVEYAQAGTIEGGLQAMGDQASTSLQGAKADSQALRAAKLSARKP